MLSSVVVEFREQWHQSCRAARTHSQHFAQEAQATFISPLQ